MTAKTLHSVRIDARLWDLALRIAIARGTTVTAVIENRLEDYVADNTVGGYYTVSRLYSAPEPS